MTTGVPSALQNVQSMQQNHEVQSHSLSEGEKSGEPLNNAVVIGQ